MTEAVDQLYKDFDPERVELQSICLACAKHPSLRTFIDAHGTEGPVCGICRYRAHRYRCCDLGRRNELINVVKALVRLYYNEFEYNRHWGGDDEPEEMLTKDNPILEHETIAAHTRNPDYSIDFLRDLFAEPYPDPERGISLYAGRDGETGMRLLQLSLNDSTSNELASLQSRLVNENYYDVEPEVRSLIGSLAPRITRTVAGGTRYYRARIGVKARFKDIEAAGFFMPIVYQPYSGKSLGSPPPQLATAGRLNRNGVAFLYLATDAATAACEVRPHPGHYLSVGEFECGNDLRIAAFDADIAQFAQSESDLELFHFVLSAGEAFASPVVPEEARRYSITQLIADCIRQHGFDGVAFKSSVSSGQNLCVFAPGSFMFVDKSATVQHVKALSYDLEPSKAIANPEPRHMRL